MSGSTPSSRLPLGTLVRFLASRPFWKGDLKGSLGIVVASVESRRDLLVVPVGTPDTPELVNVQPSTVEVCCGDQQKLWDIVAKSIAEMASPPETRRERITIPVKCSNTPGVFRLKLGEFDIKQNDGSERTGTLFLHASGSAFVFRMPSGVEFKIEMAALVEGLLSLPNQEPVKEGAA